MNKVIFIFTCAALAVLMTGCGRQVQPPLYNWGSYADSSAKYATKAHEKDIAEKHRAELEKIINDSNEKKQRVAPGLHAEYGQILFEMNKKELAKQYFILEKQTYPESSVFIDRVLIKLYGNKL